MLPTHAFAPDWNAPENVVALQTTRQGGESKACFQGFNLAQHVGDSAQAVATNRTTLDRQLGGNLRWQWLQQVHGSDVVAAPAGDAVAVADGLFTRVPGIACCVLTADCLPVMFAAKSGDEVAVAHAGWRGLAAGIIENTVNSLSSSAADLIAWLGPAIGPCHFEVGAGVRTAFLNAAATPAAGEAIEGCFQASRDAGKYRADLYAIARVKLHQLGLQQVWGGDYCTVCDEELFYSFRRDGDTGRMASIIYLKT
jgi:YfiH family protein